MDFPEQSKEGYQSVVKVLEEYLSETLDNDQIPEIENAIKSVKFIYNSLPIEQEEITREAFIYEEEINAESLKETLNNFFGNEEAPIIEFEPKRIRQKIEILKKLEESIESEIARLNGVPEYKQAVFFCEYEVEKEKNYSTFIPEMVKNTLESMSLTFNEFTIKAKLIGIKVENDRLGVASSINSTMRKVEDNVFTKMYKQDLYKTNERLSSIKNIRKCIESGDTPSQKQTEKFIEEMIIASQEENT